MFFLFHSLASAQPAASFHAPVDAVRSYLEGADRQDVAQTGSMLHKDFRVVAQMPSGLVVMDRAAYLSMLQNKKIGGTKRQVSIDAVLDGGTLWTVKGSLDGAKATFNSTWTLAKTDSGWKVVQDATVFAPKQ